MCVLCVPFYSQRIFSPNKHPFAPDWPEVQYMLMAKPVTRKGKEITPVSVDQRFTKQSPVANNIVTWVLLEMSRLSLIPQRTPEWEWYHSGVVSSGGKRVGLSYPRD